jgi:3',5'-nucleoside bisphosphate phosphatase
VTECTSESGISRADLHTHSTASDGLLAPADLIRQASGRGLSVVALTDHDTTLGLAEAIAAGVRFGLRVIPGIELSTDVDQGQVHILGYGIDFESAELLDALSQLRTARVTRVEKMLERLRELGVTLPPDSVRPSAPGASVGRPHVARTMVEAGYVGSIGEAFDRYIGEGRPAYVASERLAPEDAVRLIARAGGIPVFAHPLSSPDFLESLPSLIDAGLAGIEAYYGEYSAERREQLAQLARSLNLLATGGSDFHGVGFKEGRDLGAVPIPAEVIDELLQRLDRGATNSAN